MFRLFLLALAGLTLALLFAAVERLHRPLARAVRTMLLVLVAMLVTAGLAIGITGLVEEAWWAAVLGGGILAVALRLGWALRRPRRRKLVGQPEHVPVTSSPDPRWRLFESGLDWVGRKQARRSRTAIEAFLAERNSPSLTPEHRSLLLSCEKRVPELIDTCLERCRNAHRDERERYIDETLDTLNQIGAEADRARREVREADDRRLQVLHRYFDQVAGDSDERPTAR